jgi:hypothetical protein
MVNATPDEWFPQPLLYDLYSNDQTDDIGNQPRTTQA